MCIRDRGKDVLLETQPDVYELLDLQLGRCRLAVAAKNGWQEDLSLPLREMCIRDSRSACPADRRSRLWEDKKGMSHTISV